MELSIPPELRSTDTLQRRSRMWRRRTDKKIQLTDRDIEIFQLLTRYRYLRSTHLFALAGGQSQKRFIERLGHLYHEGGYLNRPGQQWQALNARYTPAVYELGEFGERALLQRGSRSVETFVGARQGGIGPFRRYHHELMICDVVSSIEIGARVDPNLRFISWPEILASPRMPASTRTSANPLSVPVSLAYSCPRTNITHRSEKPLIPDGIFGIAYLINGQRRYRFFALEADRNTEPVVRRSLHQSSYLRKVLQYREIVARSIFKTHWGLPNLMVLNVTANEQHMQNVMRMVDEVTECGKGAGFLFNSVPTLGSLGKAPTANTDLLTAPWRRTGYPDFYIDRI